MAQPWCFGTTLRSQVHRSNWAGRLAIILITLQLGCGKDKPTGPDVTPPAGVGTLSAAVLGSDTVLLSWTAPGDDANVGLATAYDARHSATPINSENFSQADTVGGAPTPAAPGTLQQLHATSLPGSSTQYFAVRVVDEMGNWSPISVLGPISTPADTVPPGPITALNWDAIEETSITVAWRASGDDGSRGQAASYDLRVSSIPLDEANWRSARLVTEMPKPLPATTPQRKTISGLLPGRRYYFALRVADEAGNMSGLSNLLGATTAPRSTRKLWRVSRDGTGDAPTIQAAVDSCISGDSVFVSPGIYYENIRIFQKAILLAGTGGAEVTTIDGSHAALSTVHFRGPAVGQSDLQGFTIQGGSGSALEGHYGHSGGGVLVENESIVIRDNRIENNGAAIRPLWGGGIEIDVRGAPTPSPVSIVISGNIVRFNQVEGNGGGIGVFAVAPLQVQVIRNDVFSNGSGGGDGGGIWGIIAYSSAEIRGNFIHDNFIDDHGGGVYFGGQELTQLTLVDNIIQRNSAGGRAGLDGTGGGVWLSDVRGVMANNTVVENSGEARSFCGEGQVALLAHSTIALTSNVIAFGTLGAAITCEDASTSVLTDNLFWSNPGGVLCAAPVDSIPVDSTNVLSDPQFCDLRGDARAVAASSPLLRNPGKLIGSSPYVGCSGNGSVGHSNLRRPPDGKH